MHTHGGKSTPGVFQLPCKPFRNTIPSVICMFLRSTFQRCYREQRQMKPKVENPRRWLWMKIIHTSAFKQITLQWQLSDVTGSQKSKMATPKQYVHLSQLIEKITGSPAGLSHVNGVRRSSAKTWDFNPSPKSSFYFNRFDIWRGWLR